MGVGCLSTSHVDTLDWYDQQATSRAGDLRNPVDIYADPCPECGGRDLYATRLNVAALPEMLRADYARVRRGRCADCGWAGYALKAVA